MDGRVRVLHVAETIKGGIATYLRNVLPLQAARFGRENVLVLVPDDQLDELRVSDAHVKAFVRHTSRAVTALAAARALQAQSRAFCPTVVHIHSTFAGLSCRPLLNLTRHRPRVVYCPHGWAFERIGRTARVAARAERLLAPVCDAIVCVSEAERCAALKTCLPASKLHVILNGLPDLTPPPRASLLPADAPLKLLFVGRFDRQKGFDILIDALRHVRRPVEVDVFGESVLGEDATGELPRFVHRHGWQSFDVIEPFLQRCDMLVMPSRWEGLGLSAIEAMRAGKAVIASRVGGLPEVVQDGVTGMLVAPGDAEALAQAIDTVRKDQLVQMGAMGRQRFLEKFRIEECEARLADLYREVLESDGNAVRRQTLS